MGEGRKVALIIGVDSSPQANAKLPPLKAPSLVAQQLALMLQSAACGFEIHDQRAIVGEEAAALEIQNVILDYVDTLGPDDTLLVSFCGHGVPEILESGTRDVFLATYDYHPARAKRHPERYLSMRWLRDKALLSPSIGRIILLLDCCYAGFIGDVQDDPRIADLRAQLETLLDIGKPAQRPVQSPRTAFTRVSITAALPWKQAYEHESTTAFSAALLDGLRGHREALKSDGSVTIDSLREFIHRRLGANQICGRYGPDLDVVVLARHAPPTELTAEVIHHIQQAQQERQREDRRRYVEALCIDHSGFMNDRLSSFVGRAAELEAVRAEIAKKMPTGGYVTITGQAGQGKSSLIARLISDYGGENPARHFIPFIPGPDHQVILLRDLMAQLILKHDLPEFYVASETRPSLKAYFPKLLADIHAQQNREIIFIDGLDQIEAEQTGVRDLSFLPTNPPPGIVFVLGTRPNDALRPLELLKPHDQYQLPPLSRADFDLILEHRSVRLERHFADRFYSTMQQNALYLDLVAAELSTCGIESIEEIIARISDNHENIFSLTMDRLKRHSVDWRTVIKPILGVLLAARAPFSLLALRSVLLLEDDEVRTGLMRLGGLVAQDSEGSYFLYHLKFQDYLRQNPADPKKNYVFALDEEESWHQRLAIWCGGTDAASIEQIWVDARYPAGEQQRRVYGRHYLIAHIFLAKNWEQLWSVVDAGTYGKAKLRDDPSTRAYAQDLDLARQSTAQPLWDTASALQHLPRLWRYSLLRCSLSSQANNCPPKLFRVMVAAGREREAVGMAELMTDTNRKIEALLEIGKALINDRSLLDEGRQILIRASEVALTDLNPHANNTLAYMPIAKACHEVGQASITAAIIAKLPLPPKDSILQYSAFLADRMNLSLLSMDRALIAECWAMICDLFAFPLAMSPHDFIAVLPPFLRILAVSPRSTAPYSNSNDTLAKPTIHVYIDRENIYALFNDLVSEFMRSKSTVSIDTGSLISDGRGSKSSNSKYSSDMNKVIDTLIMVDVEFIGTLSKIIEVYNQGGLKIEPDYMFGAIYRLINIRIDRNIVGDDIYDISYAFYVNREYNNSMLCPLLRHGFYNIYMNVISNYSDIERFMNFVVLMMNYVIKEDISNINKVFSLIDDDVIVNTYMVSCIMANVAESNQDVYLKDIINKIAEDIKFINNNSHKTLAYAVLAELINRCGNNTISKELISMSIQSLKYIHQNDIFQSCMAVVIHVCQRIGLKIIGIDILIRYNQSISINCRDLIDNEILSENSLDNTIDMQEAIKRFIADNTSEKEFYLLYDRLLGGYIYEGRFEDAERMIRAIDHHKMRDKYYNQMIKGKIESIGLKRAISIINEMNTGEIRNDFWMDMFKQLKTINEEELNNIVWDVLSINDIDTRDNMIFIYCIVRLMDDDVDIYDLIPLISDWRLLSIAVSMIFLDIDVSLMYRAIAVVAKNKFLSDKKYLLEMIFSFLIARDEVVARDFLSNIDNADDKDNIWDNYIEDLMSRSLFEDATANISNIQDVDNRDNAWEAYVLKMLELSFFDKAYSAIDNIKDIDDRDSAWEKYIDSTLEAHLFDAACSVIDLIIDFDDQDDVCEKCAESLAKAGYINKSMEIILKIHDTNDRNQAWFDLISEINRKFLFDYDNLVFVLSSMNDIDKQSDALLMVLDSGLFNPDQISGLFSIVGSLLRNTYDSQVFLELLVYISNEEIWISSIEKGIILDMIYRYLENISEIEELIYFMSRIVVGFKNQIDKELLKEIIYVFDERYGKSVSLEEEVYRERWFTKCKKITGDFETGVYNIDRYMAILNRVSEWTFNEEMGNLVIFAIQHYYLFGCYEKSKISLMKYEKLLLKENKEELILLYVHMGEYDKVINMIDYNLLSGKNKSLLTCPDFNSGLLTPGISMLEDLNFIMVGIDRVYDEFIIFDQNIIDIIDEGRGVCKDTIDFIIEASESFLKDTKFTRYNGFWYLMLCAMCLKNIPDNDIESIVETILEKAQKPLAFNLLHAMAYALISDQRYGQLTFLESSITKLRERQDRSAGRASKPMEQASQTAYAAIHLSVHGQSNFWQQNLDASGNWRSERRRGLGSPAGSQGPMRPPRFNPYIEESSWQADLSRDMNWRSSLRGKSRSTLPILPTDHSVQSWSEEELRDATPILLYMTALIRQGRFDLLFNHLHLFRPENRASIVAIALPYVLKTGEFEDFLAALCTSNLELAITPEMMIQIVSYHMDFHPATDLVGIGKMYEKHFCALQSNFNFVVWNAIIALMSGQRQYNAAFDALNYIVQRNDKLWAIWTIVLKSHQNCDYEVTKRAIAMLGEGAMQLSESTCYPDNDDDLFEYLTTDINYTPPTKNRSQNWRFSSSQPPRFNPYDEAFEEKPPFGPHDPFDLRDPFRSGKPEDVISHVLTVLDKNDDPEARQQLSDMLDGRKDIDSLISFLQQAWLHAQTQDEVLERLRLAGPLMRRHPEMVREVLEALRWVEEGLKW